MDIWVRKMCWIFALIVFVQALIPAIDEYYCLDSSKSKLNLSCNDDGKIFDINITAATGECNKSLCYGHTPQLIIQKLSCYWKNNCTIDLPKDIIIQSLDDSSKCIGNKPDVLILYSWKCTKRGVKIYDFPEKTDFNIPLDKGILRSHSLFPWDYFFHDFCTDCKGFTYSGTVTFWLKPKYTFIITVDKVNVTYPDSLTWYTKQNTTPRPVSMGSMSFDGSDEAVSLQLNLTNDTNGDSGFLICYESPSSENTSKDACYDMTTPHYVPKILKSKGEKETPKSKGGKKKRKNKTENNGRKKSGSKARGKKGQVN